jgi:hypothetical protein
MFNATFNTISVIPWCHVKLIMIKKVNHIGFWVVPFVTLQNHNISRKKTAVWHVTILWLDQDLKEVIDSLSGKMYTSINLLDLSSYGRFPIEWEKGGWVSVMVFNATFNNISVISWRSVVLVEETGENHRSVASHWQTLSHLALSGIRTLVMTGTGCIGSHKPYYHTITTTTAPDKADQCVGVKVKYDFNLNTYTTTTCFSLVETGVDHCKKQLILKLQFYVVTFSC